MLRAALHRQHPTVHRAATRRMFVSPVLLSKSYEDKTVAELRNEAKKRGLSSSGNKSVLLARIQQEDKRAALKAVGQDPQVFAPSASKRSVSSSSGVSAEVQPFQPLLGGPTIIGVRLPDLSQPPVEEPVQIPFVPDFWESSRVKAEEEARAKSEASMEASETPKIIVAADVSTHPLGGPVHNLYSESPLIGDSLTSSGGSAQNVGKTKKDGIWGDVLEDLSLPLDSLVRDARVSTSALLISMSAASKRDSKSHSQPLEDTERRGLYWLLGIFAGSWVVSRLATSTGGEKDYDLARH